MSLYRDITVIPRQAGMWYKGQPTPPADMRPRVIKGNIQPGHVRDYDKLQADPGGRRFAHVHRLYTPEKLTLQEKDTVGDVVMHNGDRHLIIGEADWSASGGPAAHYKYLIVREMEYGPGEVAQ